MMRAERVFDDFIRALSQVADRASEVQNAYKDADKGLSSVMWRLYDTAWHAHHGGWGYVANPSFKHGSEGENYEELLKTEMRSRPLVFTKLVATKGLFSSPKMHLARMSEEEAVTRMPAAIQRSAELRKFHAHAFPRGGGNMLLPFIDFMKLARDIIREAMRIHESAEKHNNPDWKKEMQYLQRLEERITEVIDRAPKKNPSGPAFDIIKKPIFFSNVGCNFDSGSEERWIGFGDMTKKQIKRQISRL